MWYWCPLFFKGFSVALAFMPQRHLFVFSWRFLYVHLFILFSFDVFFFFFFFPPFTLFVLTFFSGSMISIFLLSVNFELCWYFSPWILFDLSPSIFFAGLGTRNYVTETFHFVPVVVAAVLNRWCYLGLHVCYTHQG